MENCRAGELEILGEHQTGKGPRMPFPHALLYAAWFFLLYPFITNWQYSNANKQTNQVILKLAMESITTKNSPKF